MEAFATMPTRAYIQTGMTPSNADHTEIRPETTPQNRATRIAHDSLRIVRQLEWNRPGDGV
jgi:hypothetical protein